VYARFRDVPPCGPAPGTAGADCSDTRLDGPAGPDYAVFARDGSLYVTDIDQALIWKVPKGGGRAQVWLTDARLESAYGPNGVQFMADGRTLLFANTASNPGAGNATTGRLYTVPVAADGRPGQLEQVWESLPLDGPDGIALARSGNVYVALAGANQLALLSPRFEEIARTPESAAANQSEEVPLDAPGSLAFLDDRVLVTNHSAIRGDPESWAVLDVFAGERGLPLHRPRIFRPRLRLSVRRSDRGGRTVLRVRVTRSLATKRVPVRGASVRARGRRARTGARGRATLRFAARLTRPIAVTVRRRGFVAARVRVRR
jgi:hypothetical protein